ncbi:AraC family transcriptional regulator [Actinophytocola oryzae]|uniref:AraC-like DNA-binding protein n=1 Tax=Actinophytocola oryzae TaxID=502181 RepID=A0A4R7W3Y4_9PSEU|nr:AraC family transcriptional regulator [Actinophytocola oryzae]TDV57376.1 AraC-like DNA-binding protein [Actinophytocola oryzae]
MTQLAEPVIRHWDFPRSIAGTGLLVRFGTDRGVPPERLLAGSGLTTTGLSNPRAEVTAHQELRVVRNLAAALPEAGLAVGREYHATTFGILGFAFISSPTMRDAVAVALRYLDLSFTFSIPSVSIVDGEVLLTIDDRLLPDDVARFLVERDLAAIHTVIDELVPGGVPLTGVDFRFPPRVSDEEYREVFGLAPEFGCRATVARFAAAYLDEPLPQANPHTVAMCEAQCRELVSSRRARTGMAHEVRELLSGFGAVSAQMTDVARRLGVSTRTLRRRLEDEGTSFRALLDEVREALAEELLTRGAVPVEDVAYRLGYAEASSFIHAFKRWKGVTPSAFLRGR